MKKVALLIIYNHRFDRNIEKLEAIYSGRFADWEYYNMDVAIGAAMDLSKAIKL